jgi:prephenate dehydratase
MSNKIIAFQGTIGAHSHLACRKAYPDHQTLACPTFEAVFEAVRDGKAAVGMIPIENSYAGRVAEVHNILANTDVHIIGEHFLRIEHHLMAPKGTKLQDVTEVYSHPQALMQCNKSITKQGLKAVKAENTAIAAQNVAMWNDKTKAALGSDLAAEVNGLEILQRNMEDSESNLTVFLSLIHI